MNKLIYAAAAIGSTVLASSAQAGGLAPCSGPACQQPGQTPGAGIMQRLFVRQPLPAFQAAPWYMYWPYNAHFMTPAPMMGAPAAGPGGVPMANPYFPVQGR